MLRRDGDGLARVGHVGAAEAGVPRGIGCGRHDELPAGTGHDLLHRVAAARGDVVDEAIVEAGRPEALRGGSGCRAIGRAGPALSRVDAAANVRHEVLLEQVLGLRAVLDGKTCARQLRSAKDDVLLDEPVMAPVHGNRPLEAVVDGVSHDLELVSGVRRVGRTPELVDVQRIASDMVRGRIERFRARAAKILKLCVVDGHGRAMREERVAPRARRILRADHDVPRQVPDMREKRHGAGDHRGCPVSVPRAAVIEAERTGKGNHLAIRADGLNRSLFDVQRVAGIEPVIGRHLSCIRKEDPIPDPPARDRPLERDRRMARPRLDGRSNERRAS